MKISLSKYPNPTGRTDVPYLPYDITHNILEINRKRHFKDRVKDLDKKVGGYIGNYGRWLFKVANQGKRRRK